MEKEDYKLVYVLKVGYDGRKNGVYEFMFSKDSSNIDKENLGWDEVPASANAVPPEGKDVDLVDVYGSNFATQGKGNSPYVDVLQNGVSKLRLSSTDSPMTLLMGVYATPQDTNGSHLQLRINNAALSSGTYQVRITNDAGASNTANYTVR